MKWLKEQGCPWHWRTFSAAAKQGNLDNMKWLKEKGCQGMKKHFQQLLSMATLII